MALKGLRVIEIAGLAPVPFAGMVLADFGADVIRIDRKTVGYPDVLARGKRSAIVDLKDKKGAQVVSKLASTADVLLEPFRPGVMEKLGLGPDVLCSRNPGLVYARLTGFGQTGPLAKRAGHDINYLARSGILGTLARKGERPLPPINLLADFAGGGMMCAMGILLAVIERSKSGKGQVVDAAMMDGVAYLSSMIWNFRNIGMWVDEAGTNLLDSGAPFYETYRTSDGRFVSVGAIEPQFYHALLQGLGLADVEDLPEQMDVSTWPALKARFAEVFASKTGEEWDEIFRDTDACATLVITPSEMPTDAHVKARRMISPTLDGKGFEAAAAPKLSRTPGNTVAKPSPKNGQHTVEVLREAGLSSADIDDLLKSEVIVQLEDGQDRESIPLPSSRL